MFLVDVTRTLVREEIELWKPRLNERNLVIDESQPYWSMENLGLQQFR